MKLKPVRLTKKTGKYLGAVKKRLAEDLTMGDVQILVNWTNWQASSLYEELTLQEVLNVYRVSSDWVTWQAWAEDDVKAACKAWNGVTLPENHRSPC